jgi:hypothetical protein
VISGYALGSAAHPCNDPCGKPGAVGDAGLIPGYGMAVKKRSWSANNASQDLLDLTAKKDGICNCTGLVIISIYVVSLVMLCVFASLPSFLLSYSKKEFKISFTSSNSLSFLIPKSYNFLDQ